MDQTTYFEHLGRNTGVGVYLRSERNALDKTASADLDAAVVGEFNELAGAAEFAAVNEKIASDMGALDVLSAVAAELEAGTQPQELLDKVAAAMAEREAAIPGLDDDGYKAFVKGAATMLAAQTGQDIDQNIVAIAQHAADEFFGLGDEQA